MDLKPARVALTLLLALAAASLCVVLHTPLPWMIGPLLATAVVSMFSNLTHSWTPLRNAGQWVIGCALGLYFTPQVVALVAGLWWAIALNIVWALGLGLGIGGALVLWVFMRPEGRQADVLLAGLGIGAVVVGVWWLSGRLGHLAEHPLTLEESFLATNSQRMESLSFVAPVAFTLDWLMFFSDKSKLLTLGIVSTLGVAVGSWAVAVATRSFRWEGFRNAEDTANHLIGAVLMGVGGVTALGCTVGQGLSGVSTLSVGSFIALAAIIGGAVAALKYQMWRVERQG